VGRGRFCGKKILLVKPMTFMNVSGESVGKLARFYRVGMGRVCGIAGGRAGERLEGRCRRKRSKDMGGQHCWCSVRGYAGAHAVDACRPSLAGWLAELGGWLCSRPSPVRQGDPPLCVAFGRCPAAQPPPVPSQLPPFTDAVSFLRRPDPPHLNTCAGACRAYPGCLRRP